MTKIEGKTKEDYIQATIKGVIGAIPIAGAAAIELFNLLVTPPLEKRRLEWMKDIGERLKMLEDSKIIDLEKLRDNETFIDTILIATQTALRTSDKEKLEYLKNAIANTAINESIDATIRSIYLNLIDGLTVWHIKVLDFFNDPRLWFEINNTKISDDFSRSMLGAILIHLLTNAFPYLKNKDEFVEVLWNDLRQYGLHNSGSLKSIISSIDLFSSRTTKFGKEFLSFIKDPILKKE